MNTDENENVELNVPEICPKCGKGPFTGCRMKALGGAIFVTRRRL